MLSFSDIFDFELCDNYINEIGNIFEDTYLITNNSLYKIYNRIYKTYLKVTIDTNNKIEVFEYNENEKNSHENLITDNIKQVIITKLKYLKPILHLLFTEHTNPTLSAIALNNFHEQCSHIVARYSKLKPDWSRRKFEIKTELTNLFFEVFANIADSLTFDFIVYTQQKYQINGYKSTFCNYINNDGDALGPRYDLSMDDLLQPTHFVWKY